MDVSNLKDNSTWHKALFVIIIFVIVFLWMSQDAFRSINTQRGVYTSGAGLRLSSVDSSSNRGNSQLAF